MTEKKQKKSLYSGLVYMLLAVILLSLPSYNTSMEKKRGQFLVASSEVDQEPFEESVLFLEQYSLFSALAVMVNRPLYYVPEGAPDILKATKLPLYYGGPVDFPNRIYVMQNSGGTLHLEDITNLAPVPEMLEAKLAELEKSMKSRDVKILLGYAGWAPLQLTKEVLKGDWQFVVASPQDLKNVPAEYWWRVISAHAGDKSVQKSVEN